MYSIGDSLTYDGQYIGKLQGNLNDRYRIFNKGVNGNTTAQMLTRFATDILSTGKYVVIWGGVNSVRTDVSAASIESDLQAMYDAAHGMGQTVVAINITPIKTSAYWTSGRQTVLDAVNAWIMASDADYKIDAYSLLESSAGSDTLLSAYDSGDHLHLSTAGYNAVADKIYNHVAW